jgi:very-short-patch-repair endonuclease
MVMERYRGLPSGSVRRAREHDARRPADERRTRFLEAEGYRVLRFWNHEVLGSLDGVLATISGALASGTRR